MRCGVVVLPDRPWAETAPRWRAVEEMGFDHAWTYDHLVWGGLPDSEWYAAMPVLTAAATVTERIPLGTFVASPNFRHPVSFWREVQALDDVSGGRFLLGLGTGGDRDAEILGGASLTVKERVDRFREFTGLLVRLRDEDHVDADGAWFGAHDARTLPPVRRVPLLLAANGPRQLAYAARHGDGWITTGPYASDSLEDWWHAVAGAHEQVLAGLDEHGRSSAGFSRYLSLDASPVFALESAGRYEEMAGRAAQIGFTDVVVHWPRPSSPYAGDERVLEQVAGRR